MAWLAVTLAFVALRWIPGDALDATLALSGAPPERDRRPARGAGAERSDLAAVSRVLAELVRGDLGESLVSGQRVAEMIGQNLGPTAALAVGALLVAVTLGMTLGVLAGRVPLAHAARYAAEDGDIAGAVHAGLLDGNAGDLRVSRRSLGVLPGVGGEGVRYLILPACVLGFHTAGSIAQVTASSLREAAGQDFVRTARAKGLPDLDVLDHILRVGLLPVIAVIALQFGFLLGGTVITETIFVRRGLGRVMLTAVNNRDYPVIQGLVVLAALVYSLINALADVLYGLVDPRVDSDTR